MQEHIFIVDVPIDGSRLAVVIVVGVPQRHDPARVGDDHAGQSSQRS